MRRKFGIVWKYFIAFSATTTVVIFVLALLSNDTIQKHYREWAADDLMNYAYLASETFRGTFDDGLEDADKLAKELGKRTGTRITLIATDGTVLGDSDENPAEMENHSDRPEIKKALSGKIGTRTRYSTTLKEHMSYVAVPVIEDEIVKGVVRVSLEVEGINVLIGELTRKITITSIVIWFIALVLTFIFSSIFSSSVKRIVTLTKKIARGDFAERVDVKRQDELGELAFALNEMSQKLKSLFEQLQTRQDELDAIINSMSESVLVLDQNTHVRFANDSFREMFSIGENIAGRSYIELIRHAELKDTVDELLRTGQVKWQRMNFNGRVLVVNGIGFKGEGGKDEFVLVFHDITADAQIEKLKADFVANASHELRTPLTAINGYLETFEDEESETQKRFIQIIRRNVERMSNLVSDLLLLSRLEASTPQLNIEKVDLLSITEDMLKLVERPAEEKGIEVKLDIEPGISVNADQFLLEQMLLNLLDNAVKYTESGEVILRSETNGEAVIIQISDTGVGIPSEHMPRIFERFYRVDKARSRKLGGTGLGLSIVKHIVQLHGGEIDVESKSGVGTTFTVRL